MVGDKIYVKISLVRPQPSSADVEQVWRLAHLMADRKGGCSAALDGVENDGITWTYSFTVTSDPLPDDADVYLPGDWLRVTGRWFHPETGAWSDEKAKPARTMP